ncbi:hypothetical protein, partial [Klebsiella pneumoniae]|uniref:hypothetical protein n=1 Tax=Klebsiella pneumoniae TaxID=573 RepID=UPI00273107F4
DSGEARLLAEEVFCRSLASAADYRSQIDGAGFEAIDWLDMTESWTAFVLERRQGFRADRARFEAIHGAATYRALDR